MSQRVAATAEATALVDEYYDKHYIQVQTSGLLGAAQRGTHECLERGRLGMSFPVTLELGAGSLQHYPFVRHRRDQYIATDIRVPTQGLLVETLKSGDGPADLVFQHADAMRLPYADGSVDRIVAGCLVVHLPDPLGAVVEWQRVCRSRGVIDFLVPCDPGMLLRAFRRVISEPTASRQGVSPQQFRLVNAVDHVSSFARIKTLARAALQPGRELKINYYPFAFLRSWNLNAFAVFTIRPRPRR